MWQGLCPVGNTKRSVHVSGHAAKVMLINLTYLEEFMDKDTRLIDHGNVKGTPVLEK